MDVVEIVGGELDGGGAEVFFVAVELGGAGDGDDPGFLGEKPGEGDLGGGGLEAGGDLGEEVDEGLVGFAVFFGESWGDVAEIGFVEGGVGVDGAGEEAFAEGAEGDEADAEFFEGGEDFVFGFAPPEGEFGLECGDGLDGEGAADGLGGGFGEAEVIDLALGDEVFDGARDVFDRDVRIDAMLVEEVDAVGAETLEGGVGDGLDVIGAGVETGRGFHGAAIELRGNVPAELGGDDDVVADVVEGFAEELFVGEWAVDFGGVEEGDAAVDGGVEEVDAGLFVVGGAEAEAEAHAAEAEGGDLEVFAESAGLHEWVLCNL